MVSHQIGVWLTSRFGSKYGTDFDPARCLGLCPGGVLPYMGYTGMCRSTGYVFCFCDSGTGYKNRPFSLEQGIFYFRFDSGIVSNFP